MDKKSLRRLFRGKSVSEEASCEVVKKVLSDPAFVQADLVLSYMPLPDEIDTRPLLKCGKKIALPFVIGERMDFALYNEKLVEGAFGILEPEDKTPVALSEKTVILVPALAYRADGFRLGRGKGYYDRYLRGKKIISLGLIEAERIVEDFPVTETDIKVNRILDSRLLH